MMAGILGAMIIPEVSRRNSHRRFFSPEVAASSSRTRSTSFPVLLVLSLIGCLLGTYLSKPEDAAILKHFYRTTRPWGFWGPIRDKVMREDPAFRAQPRFLRRTRSTCWSASSGRLCLTSLPIFIVLRSWNWAGGTLLCCWSPPASSSSSIGTTSSRPPKPPESVSRTEATSCFVYPRSPFLRQSLRIAALLGTLSCRTASADELQHFITRRGDQLLDGDKPFRFISFNIPNLLVIEDAFEFTRPNPWRWPDEFEIEDALESIRQMGGQVVRTYVISVFREGSDMGKTVHVLGPGKFNEEGFVALDKVLEIANRKGIRLIIPFFDRATWMGGQPQYAGLSRQADRRLLDRSADHRRLQKDRRVRDQSQEHDHGRRLPRRPGDLRLGNGQRNRRHARVDPRDRRLHQAARSESPGRRRPLAARRRAMAARRAEHRRALDAPLSLGPDADFVPPIRAAHAMTKGKKPYFVGEFGFVDTPHIRRVFDAAIDDGIAGALLWSLRFHRRDGGFYWHMEVGTGGNFYKAYHWPGFASGAAYDETAGPGADARQGASRFTAIAAAGDRAARAAASCCRSKVRPRFPGKARPGPPPTTSSAPIAADGPVDHGRQGRLRRRRAVPAAVQRRLGRSRASAYYYRVTARNSAGDSAPVERRRPRHGDASHARRRMRRSDAAWPATKGDVTPPLRQCPPHAGRCAPDRCFAPGAAIVYRVDAPIRAWRVYAFAEVARYGSSASPARADGSNVRAARASTGKAFSSGQGDYGYLVPVLFQGTSPSGDQTHLRIELPATAEGSEPLQISRVEIDYGGIK